MMAPGGDAFAARFAAMYSVRPLTISPSPLVGIVALHGATHDGAAVVTIFFATPVIGLTFHRNPALKETMTRFPSGRTSIPLLPRNWKTPGVVSHDPGASPHVITFSSTPGVRTS